MEKSGPKRGPLMRRAWVSRRLPTTINEETTTAQAPRTPCEWLDSPVLLRIIKRVACQYGILPAEIDDLAQEVRIALWSAERQVDIKPGWVFATASHKAVDLLRRCRRSESTMVLPHPPPREAFELMYLIEAQVAHLPERLRVFYRLRYLEGLTEREIGDRTGLCRASVRWLGLQFLKNLKLGVAARGPRAGSSRDF